MLSVLGIIKVLAYAQVYIQIYCSVIRLKKKKKKERLGSGMANHYRVSGDINYCMVQLQYM